MYDDDQKMKCPKCGLYSLREGDDKIMCKACGYALTAGQAAKFRLFKLLEREDNRK